MKAKSRLKTSSLTDTARLSTPTMHITKANGLMENITAKESSFGLMDLHMKENMNKERRMELEHLPTLLKRFIKGNGSMGDSQD